MILKNYKLAVQYVGTNFICYESLIPSSKRFILYNIQDKKIVSKADSPIEFDKIIYKNNGGV